MKQISPTKKILIADDHAVVRKGLRRIIEEGFIQAEIKEVSTGFEVEEAVASENFDAIVMDIAMPGKNGLDTLKQLKINQCPSPVLILSMYSEDQYAIRSIKAGACGFLNKESAPEELVNALNSILRGKKYFTAYLIEQMSAHLSEKQKPIHELLSDREFQVMQLLANGKTVNEIAEQFHLSIATINTYRSRVLEKLKLRNHSELTRYVIESGLSGQ